MSSGATDEAESPDIPVYRRELHRLERGAPVIVEYQSNRGNKDKKTRSGEITNVQALGADTVRVWLYDSNAERKIEVTLRESFSSSSVRSQKTDKMSTVGTPTRVLASEDKSTVEEVEQEQLLAKRNNDFDVVVAAAKINSNKSILKWIEQHDLQ